MQTKDWSGILVYIEAEGQKVKDVSLELLGEAFRLAEGRQEKVLGIYIGDQAERVVRQVSEYGLETLYHYEISGIFQAHLYEQAMVDCIAAVKPAIVLLGGTSRGRALAARSAAALQTGLTADCTQLDRGEEGHLIQIRPAFGGNIMASILTPDARPQMATVRPGIFRKPQPGRPKKGFTRHKRGLEMIGGSNQLLAVSNLEKTAKIEQCELLLVIGRGVKQKEDLKMFRELAALMGGKVASSRALVEKGWMHPEEQIGLSGTTVAPKCMITFGVSGTVQFMAGMKNTPNIIAVNHDREANIFQIAHFPICSDLYKVLPKLLNHYKSAGHYDIVKEKGE